VEGLLRDELGFRGLVFTDDMEMKAIAARMPVPQACVRAIAAGCDAVLVCSGNHDLQVATLEAIIRAVEQEELPFSRVEQALARQRAMKERYLAARAKAAAGGGRPERTRDRLLGSEEHQAVAAEMARFA
jgi:beta-N-acetylhexosaminidase